MGVRLRRMLPDSAPGGTTSSKVPSADVTLPPATPMVAVTAGPVGGPAAVGNGPLVPPAPPPPDPRPVPPAPPFPVAPPWLPDEQPPMQNSNARLVERTSLCITTKTFDQSPRET